MFSKLLSIASSDEISSLIDDDDFFKPENCDWRPYGGRDNNAGQVEGQMKSSSNALVEKLTNSIDALLITHAHLDHVGRIPKLVREGYQGPIYSTPQTRELAELVLTDAVGILAIEAKQKGGVVCFWRRD